MPLDPNDDFTSGTTDFTLTAGQIVAEAFDLLQMGVEGEKLTEDMFSRGLRSLNLVLRTLQADGILLATYEDGSIWMNPDQERYVIENEFAANFYQQRELAQDATAGATTVFLSLDPANIRFFGITDDPDFDWFIGILDNNRVIFTTRVDSYDDSTGETTLRDALEVDSNAGNQVFLYRDEIERIERILDIRRADNFLNDVPINHISRQEYYAQPTKYVTGIVVEAYYQRRRGKGELFVWPVPFDSTKIIKFSYERQIQDMSSPDDQLDLKTYWLEPVVAMVAERLTLKYRVPADVKAGLLLHKEEVYNKARNFDDEVTDFSFSLNRESR